jgi:hypothetical protein
MSTNYDARERAVEAVRLLNSFLLDFVVGTRGLEIFDCPAVAPSVSRTTAIGLNRMAISHLVISLAKWKEFYGHYRAILPADVRDACLGLHDQVIARGIVDFRNTVVGHILNDGTKRPLTSREIDERLERVIAGEREDFLRWINNPAHNAFPHSVVAITEHVRDRLRVEYQLSDEEIR